MYRRSYPPGVPDSYSIRTAHLNVAADNPLFSPIPEDERAALFDSLTKTFRRSEYHRQRFEELRSALDARRAGLPGEVFWDEFVETLYFELQAFCGAARMVLDELVYIVARRHGVAPKRAKRRPWETAELFQKPVPAECQVAEVELMRQKTDWFELLNSYRNSFFHHGWRHGSGHFSGNDARSAARNPAANAMLVPDQKSIGGRSKPHERTYADGTTIDDVMRPAKQGLSQLLQELCEGPWSTAEPTPGTKPRNEHPNMIVSLANPAIFFVHNIVLIPFFTTEELARAFDLPEKKDVEVVDIPVTSSVTGQPAVSFTLKGLDQLAIPPGVTRIKVLLDPVIKDPEWRQLECAASIEVEIEKVLAAPGVPTSLPVVNATRLFVWRGTSQRDWRS